MSATLQGELGTILEWTTRWLRKTKADASFWRSVGFAWLRGEDLNL
jgi:hypothetical protein